MKKRKSPKFKKFKVEAAFNQLQREITLVEGPIFFTRNGVRGMKGRAHAKP
jgi:hypothetical protein